MAESVFKIKFALWQLGVALLIATYWGVLGAQRGLSSVSRQAGLTRPYIVNGHVMNFESVATLDQRTVAGPAKRRSILVVAADSCPYSRDEQASWQQLFESLPHDPELRVLLISKNGRRIVDALADVLRARQLPHETYIAGNIAAFVAQTGLAATPSTYVLDENLVVRRVYSRPTPTDIRDLAAVRGQSAGAE